MLFVCAPNISSIGLRFGDNRWLGVFLPSSLSFRLAYRCSMFMFASISRRMSTVERFTACDSPLLDTWIRHGGQHSRRPLQLNEHVVDSDVRSEQLLVVNDCDNNEWPTSPSAVRRLSRNERSVRIRWNAAR